MNIQPAAVVFHREDSDKTVFIVLEEYLCLYEPAGQKVLFYYPGTPTPNRIRTENGIRYHVNHDGGRTERRHAAAP